MYVRYNMEILIEKNVELYRLGNTAMSFGKDKSFQEVMIICPRFHFDNSNELWSINGCKYTTDTDLGKTGMARD